MGVKINKEGLSRWIFAVCNSGLIGIAVGLAGLAAMFKVAPTDFNFQSTYNWGIVLQAAGYLIFFGFIGGFTAGLLKSPLHYDDVFVVTLDKGTETTITIVKDNDSPTKTDAKSTKLVEDANAIVKDPNKSPDA